MRYSRLYGAGDLQKDGSREASVSINVFESGYCLELITKSDVWAIGVITYFLLCGYTPFDRDSNLEEMQAILVADYSFTPLEYWRGVSLTAREFIRRCLTIDPSARMTAHEALSHPWIADLGKTSAEGEEDLLPTVKKNFNARRTLHAAIDTIRAINQLRAGGAAGMMVSRSAADASRL
jgi:calcium/calmodulin-dependent protein kinase I